MSHEQKQKQQQPAPGAGVSSPVAAGTSTEADALFRSIALFLQAVAQGSVQRPELYAPTLNRLSERAEQLVCHGARAPLDPLPLSLLAPLPAGHMAVRITCPLSRAEPLTNQSHMHTCFILLISEILNAPRANSETKLVYCGPVI